jgi:hypothetical protein
VALVETIGVERLVMSAVHQYLRQTIILPLVALNPGRQVEIQSVFEMQALPAMAPLWSADQVKVIIAGFFGQTFTAEELRELQAFFATPAGRKYAANLTPLNDALTGLVARLGTTLTAQGAMTAAATELQHRGIRFPQLPPNQRR